MIKTFLIEKQSCDDKITIQFIVCYIDEIEGVGEWLAKLHSNVIFYITELTDDLKRSKRKNAIHLIFDANNYRLEAPEGFFSKLLKPLLLKDTNEEKDTNEQT